MKLHINKTEVLTQITSINNSASSIPQFLNGRTSIFSLNFETNFKNNYMLQFLKKVISAHIYIIPEFEDIWNAGRLFDNWRGSGSNCNLINIEICTKLTSILIII